MASLVEISGEQARLLPVGERAEHLFGKDQGNRLAGGTGQLRKKRTRRLDLFKVIEQAEPKAARPSAKPTWNATVKPFSTAFTRV